MTREGKIDIARKLDILGVKVIEAGYPKSSPEELETVAAIAQKVTRPIICALARVQFEDIDAAWEAIKYAVHPRIHVFVSSSDIHIQSQLKTGRKRVLEMAIAGVQRAKQYCQDVQFSAMDATRTDRQYLYQLIRAVIDAGATTVNIPDTVGYADPDEYKDLISSILNPINVPNIDRAIVSVHCHNDLGQATANTLAGVKGGARQAEVTVNGIGERAGNTALEEVVMTIKTRGDIYPVHVDDIDTTKIISTSRAVSRKTGMPVQSNKAIVGASAFSHKSGIHQDGVLKDRKTYEIMDPASIGLSSEIKLPLGKHNGNKGILARLERLGFEVTQEELKVICFDVKSLGNIQRVRNKDLVRIASEILEERRV